MLPFSIFSLDFDFWVLSSKWFCKAFLVKACRSGLFMNSLVCFHLRSNSFVMRKMKRFLMLCWLRPGKLQANLAHFFGWIAAFSKRQMSSSRVQSFLLNSRFIGKFKKCYWPVQIRIQMIQPSFTALAVFFEVFGTACSLIELVWDFWPFYLQGMIGMINIGIK